MNLKIQLNISVLCKDEYKTHGRILCNNTDIPLKLFNPLVRFKLGYFPSKFLPMKSLHFFADSQ